MDRLTLVINTAEKHVQFVLAEGGVPVCSQTWLARQGGTEILVPAIRDALKKTGHAFGDIARIACTAGPGNFTGLRIGITTASGLTRATGAVQAGLDYLQVLAFGAMARPGETVAVMTNARKGLAFRQVFRIGPSGIPAAESDISLLPVPPFPEGFEPGTPDRILGSAVTSNREYMESVFPAGSMLDASADIPSAAALMRAASLIRWEDADGSDIAPRYLRDCDAMDNFTAISKAQGRTPELAMADLQRMLASGIRSI